MRWREKQFEEKMSKHIDLIYKSKLKVKAIDRSIFSEIMTLQLDLDKNYGIDVVLQLNNGTKLTIQEKVRQSFYLDKYGPTLCLEYMNNPSKNELGEWFKAIPQIYFVGYANKDETGFKQWYFIDTVKLKLEMQNLSKKQLESFLQKNKQPKNANFLAVPIKFISNSIIKL